jgi:uncharacterized protein (TIGR03000 family)
MFTNLRKVLVALLFAAIAGTGSLALAAHGGGGGHGGGHGGGGHGWSGGGGHGWSGGGGHGWSGGGGHGWGGGDHSWSGGHGGFNYWGGGGRYYSNRFYGGWPYSYSYYRPYRYFAYPYLSGYYGYPSSYFSYGYGYPYYYSYPSDYYSYGANDYYADTPQYDDSPSPQQYVASRPIADVARIEVRLPDPDGTLWVQGQQMTTTGSVRHFRSPQLDPSQQYTYNLKAQWNDNGKLVTDERQVKVQANGLAVVDFTQPTATSGSVRDMAMPPLPPPTRQTTE